MKWNGITGSANQINEQQTQSELQECLQSPNQGLGGFSPLQFVWFL